MNLHRTRNLRFVVGIGAVLTATWSCSSTPTSLGDSSAGGAANTETPSKGGAAAGGRTNQNSAATGGTKTSGTSVTSKGGSDDGADTGGAETGGRAASAGGSRASGEPTGSGGTAGTGGTRRTDGTGSRGGASNAGGAPGTSGTNSPGTTAATGGGAGTAATAPGAGGRLGGSGGNNRSGDAGTAGSNTTAGSSGAGGSTTGTSGAGFGTVAVENLDKDGTFKSTTVQSTGPGSTYTIYRPQELAPNGSKNPVVAWISGGGSSHSQYTLLPHLATHGFVVIASNTVPAMGAQAALGKEMVAAIDWIVTESTRSGSDFNGKVDASKVAAMGYSMGALAAMSAAADPRWTTTVHISGGAGDTTIKNLHSPAAFICGASGTDIAGANCALDFDAATTPVFYGVFKGGDHLGVRTSPYQERIRAVVTGWLRWQLMSDQALKPMFVGDQCTVCKDSNWTVKQKNLQ